MNRTTKRKTAWTPNDSGDMVCSEHFVDGAPSLKNPNPTLKLGYEKPAKRVRRELIRKDFMQSVIHTLRWSAHPFQDTVPTVTTNVVKIQWR